MISNLEIMFQLFLAAALGGLIGLERERKSWFAGLRTHMLVCIGSTLIMIVSQFGFENTLHKQLVILDPSRIAAQVVSGIGFLGAGTILFWKNKIKGLTTAASLWAVAAIGLSIGGALYVAAIIATVLILIILAALKPIEKLFLKSYYVRKMEFSAEQGFSLTQVNNIIKNLNYLSIVDLEIEKSEKKEFVYLTVECRSEVDFFKLVDEIKSLHGVEKIESIE
jgi:putative Mg2+ transporter-C (MgtC) family protein